MAGYLRRRNGTYWFRRRVPNALAQRLGSREIQRSLRTANSRVAALRAKQAWLATERAFHEMALNPTLAAAQARLLIDQLLGESVFDSPTAAELVEAFGRGDRALTKQLFNRHAIDVIMSLPDEDRLRIGMHMTRMADQIEVSSMRGRLDWEDTKAKAALLQAADAQERAEEAERQIAETDVARRVAARLYEMSVAASAPPHAAEEPVSSPVPPPNDRKKAPRFSAVENPFIEDKQRGPDGYSGQTVAQTRATFRLWVELIGDWPVSDYTGTDAGRFRDLLLRLPASHGKGGRIDAKAAVAEADRKQVASGTPVTRLSMKTAKRHFSTLSQLWAWLKPRSYVGDNIFRGFTFAGTKSNRRQRDDWSAEDLQKLLRCSWIRENSDSARRWVPLIALFSGLRLEEICRLRPFEDIGDIEGVPVFRVQTQPDGWTPKSEAGERVVPVHPVLQAIGLLDLVARRRAAEDGRLFPELRPSGPDGKLSADFSRRFGKLKDSLGVARTTTFHSFRHSVSTVLRNTETPETWIDTILGHEGEQRSVGASVYLKRIGIQNLRKTVEAIIYPDVDAAVLRPV